MSLFDLRNNPNFLQCWRERNRPATVGSAFTLLLIVEAMIFTNAYYDGRMGSISSSDATPWFVDGIFSMAILQAVILLFFGSLHAYRLSSRERSNRTIDFHRSSPTPRANQILGLMLGSTSLEWWVSLLIFAVQLILAAIHGLSLLAVIQFNFQLALGAIFYHALFCVMGISRDPLKNKMGAIGLLVGIYIIASVMIANKLSFIYQLSWMPAFDQFELALKGEDLAHNWTPDGSNQSDLNYTLFGVSLLPVPFQMLVQIPFLALFLTGIGRRFTNVEQPIFSKGQVLGAAFFTFVLYTGSYTSLYFFGNDKYFHQEGYIVSLLVIMMFFAIFGGILTTPTQINYLRGLRRAKKLNIPRLNWAHNCSSNSVWCVLFCLLCVFVLGSYFQLFGTPPKNAAIASSILLGHIIFFVCFVEFFNLSSMHNKKAILFTSIVILWFLIPLFGLIVFAQSGKMPTAAVAFFAPSPIFGMGETVLHLMEQKIQSKFQDSPYASSISMVIVLMMGFVATLLAEYERRRLRKLN